MKIAMLRASNNRNGTRMTIDISSDIHIDLHSDILTELWPRLTRRARRLSRSREEAEDLAQEAVLRLCQALRGGAQITAPDRYAMILLHNLARQRWRQRRETESYEDDMIGTQPEAPGRIACAELQAAILRLPEDQAALMSLVAAGETSPKQLAAQVGVPKGTIMSRLARARASLRRDLGLLQDSPVSELL
ncbi:RNA polymerase sigma factor [Sulfitobacter aestuarii]|uniref:RNA polymerase sigma factor n=1 Tax=Sulfitobacter aestuarii TaxID=2161676 RepID=A0ABW5TZX3_9RHOB